MGLSMGKALWHSILVFKVIYLILRYNLWLDVWFTRRQTQFAHNLAKAITRLGPAFIKLGQGFSTRPDIVGEKIATSLKVLQDRMPPFSYEQVCKMVRKSFGRDIPSLFAEFSPVPVAAASIAQVHKARTIDGRIVAVKILRPHIEQRFKHDHALFRDIAFMLEQIFPRLRRMKFLGLIDLLGDNLSNELDLRMEAAAASQLAENLKDDNEVVIPEVLWGLTSKYILTTTWCEGIKISDTKALLEAGLCLKELSRSLAVTFFNMVYRDGFFHADLHPGNIFVEAHTGKLVLVDFGIIGKLNHDAKLFVAEIFYGFIKRDYMHVAKVYFRMGFIPKHQSITEFALAVRAVGEPIVGQPVANISAGELLEHLFRLTNNFEIETQPELMLLQKTMMLVEGVGMLLDSKINMWKLAEPWIDKWVLRNLSVEARIIGLAKECAEILAESPRIIHKLKQIITSAEGG